MKPHYQTQRKKSVDSIEREVVSIKRDLEIQKNEYQSLQQELKKLGK